MHIELVGTAGRLEALLELPSGAPRAAVIVAHPHPEYGGTMRSRVVHELAGGFRRVGAAVLRFNFRGVGLSAGAFDDGRGETDDVKAALDALAARVPLVPMWVAGYSFGAWVATAAGAGDPRVTALVAVAPPLDDYDFGALADSTKPKFLVHGERDERCPLKAMRRFYAAAREPKELVVIDAADHAFDGKASEVGDAIEDLFDGFDT